MVNISVSLISFLHLIIGVLREELVLDPLPREDERRLLISLLPVLAEGQLDVVQRGEQL